MVCNIPAHWKYRDSMELLFYFYQASNELLDPSTSDTYRLPLHNTYTLCYEIQMLYTYLRQNNQLETYYTGYIPPIIDELIEHIHNDDLLKGILSSRLDCILTGLAGAKENHSILVRWLDMIEQICSAEQYCEAYRKKIIEFVYGNKDKEKLSYALANYYVSLREILGYSEEYLFYTLRSYFANVEVEISSCNAIEDFLNRFDGKAHEFKMLFLVDNSMAEMYKNIITIKEYSGRFVNVEEVTLDAIKQWKPSTDALNSFIQRYKHEAKQYQLRGKHNRDRRSRSKRVKALLITIDAFDPHYAYEHVSHFFSMMHNWECYFRHQAKRKVIIDCLWIKDNEHYIPVKHNRVLNMRPNMNSTTILSRVNVIMDPSLVSRSASRSMAHAFALHDDAVSSKDPNVMLRSFWTASEALFAVPERDQNRDNVISSYLAVIQKTYILKRLRCVYDEICKCVDVKALSDNTCITDFASFVLYFAKNKENSSEMKKIYALMGNNYLLRSRVFRLRKDLSSGSSIRNLLLKHEQKIKWQLFRIYRVRNLSTHAGRNSEDAKHLMNNLHNYFDYVINYMICKGEHGDFIASVGSVVFEAKQDNQIYMEYLKENQELNAKTTESSYSVWMNA